ncbi:hypothetical protein F4802DRAFT_616058 [Xylaria palmicola]|nr:hypothetical protein F4802DRAFT_616058 [Xylaria palmicola]
MTTTPPPPALMMIEIDPLAPPPPRVVGARGAARNTPRPKGIHTKHLTELERFRVRTLYYDAMFTPRRIRQVTGYTPSQIKTAVSARSAAVGKRRGRTRKARNGNDDDDEGPSSRAGVSTGAASNDNANLIHEAQAFFAQHDDVSPEGDDDEDSGTDSAASEEEEGEDATRRLQTPPTTRGAPSAGARRRRPRPLGFGDLPAGVRLHIWRCALSAAPTQPPPPPRSWAVAVLPRRPWLEVGEASPPPHVTLAANPPWDHYVGSRHVPATVLSRVGREARRAVLERCTPVPVARAAVHGSSSSASSEEEKEKEGKESSQQQQQQGIPPFVWIDRFSDVIHFFGEPFRPELFEMAGRCACPELYR